MKVSLLNIATLYEALQQPTDPERNIILVDGDHAELLTRVELDARVKMLAAPVAPSPVPELRLADVWRDADKPNMNRAARRSLKRKHRK